MLSGIVHCVEDRKNNQNCLYVSISASSASFKSQRLTMAIMLPYITSALRQVEHFPYQKEAFKPNPDEGLLQHD
jgi:hypothetical protein